jgi:hypothetical protein
VKEGDSVPAFFEVSFYSLTAGKGAGFLSSTKDFVGIEADLIPISFSSTSSFVVSMLYDGDSSTFFTSFGFGLMTIFGFTSSTGFSAIAGFGTTCCGTAKDVVSIEKAADGEAVA